jgi:uncharacterized protein (DUF433 family)
MNQEDLLERITVNPKVLAGKPTIGPKEVVRKGFLPGAVPP